MTIGIDELAPAPTTSGFGMAQLKVEGARIAFDRLPRPDPREFQGEVRMLRWLDEDQT